MSQPAKSFNTAGVCNSLEHYMIPVVPRLPDVFDMIELEYNFAFRGPRKSGKTTCLVTLTEMINSEGQHFAINCSLATLSNIKDDDQAMQMVVDQINTGLVASNVPKIRSLAFEFIDRRYMSQPDLKVRFLLKDFCNALDRELVVFFDDADCLHEDPLITFLAQIRDGYLYRSDTPGTRFPSSLALVGMRDIRDYLYRDQSEERSTGLGGSPFNVREETMTLADFSFEEIRTLYGRHTAETGQIFEPGAVGRSWYWTEGQSCLVNALTDDVIVKQFRNDFSRSVTGADIDLAARDLILRNPPHFDSLLERLKEPRVRRVIEPVITGAANLPNDIPDDDVEYVIDLRLLKNNFDDGKSLRASNPIYGELIVQAFTDSLQE
jgi:hypothetical protein